VSDGSALPSNDEVFSIGGSLIDRTNTIDCYNDNSNAPTCFLTAGTNTLAPIYSDINTVTPSEMDQRNDDVLFDGEVSISSIADTTTNPEYNQNNPEKPFQNFPGFSSSAQARDPFFVWQQNYGE
jgi:hypothetical protein